MPINFTVATTAKELQAVFRLRHDVFVGEEGYFAATSDGLSYDAFDAYPTTSHVLATIDGKPAGTLRITIDSGAGLPWDHQEQIARRVESVHGRCASIGGLAIRRSHRHRRSLFFGLVKMAMDEVRRGHRAELIAAVNSHFEPGMRKLGFKCLGEPFQAPGFGPATVAMAGHVDGFRSPYDRLFSADSLAGHTDTRRRLRYDAGESVSGVPRAIITRGAFEIDGVRHVASERAAMLAPAGATCLVAGELMPIDVHAPARHTRPAITHVHTERRDDSADPAPPHRATGQE